MSVSPDGDAPCRIPAGWRLMPEKATPEMVQALALLSVQNVLGDDVYAGLIAAAPEAPKLPDNTGLRSALEQIGAMRSREFWGEEACGPGEQSGWTEHPTPLAKFALAVLAAFDANQPLPDLNDELGIKPKSPSATA